MGNIAVVFWSGTGNTEAMADAIARGAEEAGAKVSLLPAAEFSADRVEEFEKLAFGCPPTGVEELEEDVFAPMFAAAKPYLKGKPVGLFGSYGWGDGEWMRNWEADAAAAGILLMGEGLTVNETPDEDGIAACEALGKALANA